MMIDFDRLNDREVELMYKAPFLVCILIAGADGKIDRKEIKEAISIAEKKHKKATHMTAYFRELTQDFEDKLKILIQGFPYESTQRNPLIVSELAELNEVLPKIPMLFAVEFYTFLTDIASGIASSSGGLMGLRDSIDAEEAKYIKLSMIQKPSGR
jgi:hypothetical protein